MAKYTELFSEYLEELGGLDEWEYPEEFDLIDGFKDLFVTTFFDREIGFETPVLFTLKLKGRAALIVPPYADKIAALDETYQKLNNPTKTHTKSGTLTRTYGAETDKIIEQPFNTAAAQASPRTISERGEHTDTETYNNYTDTDAGMTSSEQLALIQALTTKTTTLKEQCLREFEPLFMCIY